MFENSWFNGTGKPGALSLLAARPFSRSTRLCGFESKPGLALQANERGFDGEILIQFMLLGCREIACACLLGKLIHAVPVRVRKLPAKQGTRFIGRQRMTIGTNNAVPNACSKGPTC